MLDAIAWKCINKWKKDNQLSEDELKTLETQVQKILEGINANLDDICASKEKEVMEIWVIEI